MSSEDSEGDGGRDSVEATLLLTKYGSTDEEEDSCEQLLKQGYEPDELSVVKISHTNTVPDMIEEICDGMRKPPKHLYVLSDTDMPGAEEASVDISEERVSLAYVDPDDLTGMGIRIQEILNSHEEDDSAYISFCYDSLSTLLQYHETPQVFRFLHTTIGVLKNAGASSHFHLNPDTVENNEMNKILQLFDRKIER